jgi:predicted DCC family thiol-disulfide oxidoreductase YuxK
MKALANKLIIYDSNCKVCSSLRDVVLKFTAIPEEKVKAYKDLNQELSKQADPDRFKNVMALIDTAGGKTIYGAEGVAYIFSSQYKSIDFLFHFKPLFRLFTFIYKTQAYNRYIIATPKSKFKCDCFPDRVVKFRVSYIVMTLLISILFTGLFGVSLKNLFNDISVIEAATQMLLMAGTGWVLQTLLAILMLRDKALDYVGHLGSIMVVGLLILVPSMLFSAFTDIVTPWIPAISVMLSSGYMLYLRINRVRYLDLSQGWTISWFLFLHSTALFRVYIFHLKTIL